MSHNIFTALEIAIKRIAKENMHEHEYQNFINGLRRTKMIRVGSDHRTMHDHLMDCATDIANWATGYRYDDVEHKVEEKKRQAIANIKAHLGWR